MADADPPVPRLLRVCYSPTFGPDGTLRATPGYHPGGLWIHPTCRVPSVSRTPSDTEVESAKELITGELLGEFPFVDNASRAHAVAALLHPFVSSLVDGPTPITVIDSLSGPGTGKDLLADVLTAVYSGKGVSPMSEATTEDEWRKRITAQLLGAPDYILIDNVRDTLNSAALAAAITSICWQGRLLGQSRVVDVPVRCCWLATGNSVRSSREIARRMVRVQMDAKVDQPWLRIGFKHQNLRQWSAEHRGELVWAALTIVQRWIAGGMPKADVVLGSFEGWAGTMGGLLSSSGIDGFLGNVRNVYEEVDEETREWTGLLELWFDAYSGESVTATEVYELAAGSDLLGEILRAGSTQAMRIRLGKALSRMVGRRFGRFRIVAGEPDRHRKVNQYRLELAL